VHGLLSAALVQVTDASGASLASHCSFLSAVKLTKAMTDSTIIQLAQNCPKLQEADLHRCVATTAAAGGGMRM
jgi:hypothetical protein